MTNVSFIYLATYPKKKNASGRGMLSVIVVHKVGDVQPGPWFFELAKQLGRDTSDILKCWVEELRKSMRTGRPKHSKVPNPAVERTCAKSRAGRSLLRWAS